MNEEDILNVTDLENIKSVLKYLVTQEKIRAEEIAALKEMITGVDSYAKEYVDGQNFNEFKSTYGEKLDPYNSTFQKTEGDDFDMTRSTYDSYKELGDENVSQDEFVSAVIEEADKYITDLKNALGLPADAEVEVTANENGVEVKADTDGDGEVEPIEVEPVEEAEDVEQGSNEEEDTSDIDEAVENYKPKH